jgi:hypothetical protein
MTTLRVELTCDERIDLYAAWLAAGFRLFEPGGYDPAETWGDGDVVPSPVLPPTGACSRPYCGRKADPGYRMCPRCLATETTARRARKPAGACANAYCKNPPAPGKSTCDRCREYRNAWARSRRKSRAKGDGQCGSSTRSK